jgi:hypothetical protein
MSAGIVICVAAGASQVPLIRQAAARGYRVLGIDADPLSPGLALCELKVVHSTHDAPGALQAVIAALGPRRPVALLARTTGAPLFTAVEIARHYGLPGLTRELVQVATGKSVLRNFCHSRGLPAPDGMLWNPARRDPTGRNLALSLLPAIVKPDETIKGKAGITFCETAAQLDAAVAAAAAMTANGQVEISSWLDGVDVGCFCRIAGGQTRFLAWWDELVGLDGQGRIVGLGLGMPSVIEGGAEKKDAEDLIRAFVACFPQAEAMLAVSLRLDFAGKPHFIEIHADLGGDGIAEWLFPAAGVSFDFFAGALQVALGQDVDGVEATRNPTLLHYTDPALPLGHRLLMEGNVRENLRSAAEIFGSRPGGLSLAPAHGRWYDQRRA